MRNKYTSATSLQGATLGLLVSGAVMTAIFTFTANPGETVPARLEAQRFSIAMLAGPKQSAQEAPESAEKTAEQVVVAPQPSKAPAQVVAAKRETSLPEAVKAAQTTSAAKKEAVKPVEVLPPAKVSMPGGKLKVEDTGLGDDIPDPFAIKPRQVYIRILIGESGKALDGRIVRSGGDVMRDNMILRAMTSRSYNKEHLIRISDAKGQPIWQLDLVIDYGTNDLLP